MEKSKPGTTYWICRCDCGKIVSINLAHLRNSHTRSCGCLFDDMVEDRADRRRSKLPFNTKIRGIWNAQKRRCFDENNQDYHHYGGRGIKMYNEWVNNFKTYYDYIMSLPNACEKGFSIDRIDNDGNYEPGNVRWATQQTQRRNSRNVKLTLEKANTIRSLWRDGINTKKELAVIFDVSIKQIRLILNDKIWVE